MTVAGAPTRVLCCLNQKGGVGKTTTSVNVADALVRSGHPVLGIDLDPQGHFAATLGVDGLQPGLDDVLMHGAPLDERVVEASNGMPVVPPGPALHEFEQIAGGQERGWRLRQAIDGHRPSPPFVMVDCPPSSGLLAMNALLAADDLVIPVSCDYLSLEGLAGLMRTLMRVEKGLGVFTRKFIAVTRFNQRRRLPRDVLDKLREYFPGQVLRTPIRDNVALAEAPGFAKTIFEYRPASNGAQDYAALAEDLRLRRVMDEPATEEA